MANQSLVKFHALFGRPLGFFLVDAEGGATSRSQRQARLVAITHNPGGIADHPVFGREGAGSEVRAAVEVGGRAPEDCLGAELEGQELSGLGCHHEWVALAEGRQQLSGWPAKVAMRPPILIGEVWGTDDHVGRECFTDLPEVQEVITGDKVTGGADVDPVTRRRGDALIPRGVKPAVAFNDTEAWVL